MTLLQIFEPGQTPLPHEFKYAVGIDLGTTNSLVATVRGGDAEVLPDTDGNYLLPSVVRYSKDSIAVGYEPKKNAEKDPLNTIISIKRLMGRGIKDVTSFNQQMPYKFVEMNSNGMPYIHTVGGDVSPVNVSAEILSVLAKRGEDTLGGKLDGAVITVPAYFDEAQRQATKDAAKVAGLKVLRLLNEPTAAAVAYGLNHTQKSTVAIYDLGGGTFDISILKLNDGVFEVLSTGGDTALGGDDFDLCIAQLLIDEANCDGKLTHSESRGLMALACAAKEQLTTKPQVELSFEWSGGTINKTFSQNDFNVAIEPLITKTLKVCKRALRDAKLKTANIDQIVMVGGSTRTPYVRKMVAELFKKQPLVDIDPDKVVAIGAAIQADILIGNSPSKDMLLLDVNPLSLGLETMGGLVEKIIPRNATIPVARAQEFTTHKDGQTAMSVHVLQGERDLVDDCRSLARFTLKNIPSMVAGAARIRVSFQVDADGLLSVAAKEMSTGTESSIEVKPSYGLEEEEVSRMIRDSIDHANDDVTARQLREKQVEAESLLVSLENALSEDGLQLLSKAERLVLDDAIIQLKSVITTDDLAAITSKTQYLSQASNEYAARRMDVSIKKALAGESLDAFVDDSADGKPIS